MARGWSRLGLLVGWLGLIGSVPAQPTSAPPTGAAQVAPEKPPVKTPGGIQGWMLVPVPLEPAAIPVEEPPPPVYQGPVFHVGFEYLVYYTRKQTLPPLVTRGFLFDPTPGALGQENTTVILQGNEQDTPWHKGGRLTFGAFLESNPYWSIEGNYFLLEHAAGGVAFAEDGSLESDVLARPFTNAATGEQDAFPVAFPTISSGSIAVATTRRLFGGELNLRGHYWESENSRIVLLTGFRHFQLEESLTISSRTTDIPDIFGNPGFDTFVSDRYHTRNRFMGGQVGGEWEYHLGPAFLQATGKLGLGMVNQTLRNNALSQVADLATGLVTTSDTSGLYIGPNNLGRFGKARWAWLPEGNIKLGVDFNQYLRLTVGYTFMYLSSVIRPTDQVDFLVNPQAVNDVGTLNPPMRTPSLTPSNFWAHGLDIALRFSF